MIKLDKENIIPVLMDCYLEGIKFIGGTVEIEENGRMYSKKNDKRSGLVMEYVNGGIVIFSGEWDGYIVYQKENEVRSLKDIYEHVKQALEEGTEVFVDNEKRTVPV